MPQEITELNVWEVSVVDKPANRKQFIAIKSQDGGNEMTITAEVIKKLLPSDITVEKVAEQLEKHADPEGFTSVVNAIEGQIEKMDTDARDAVGTLVEAYLGKSKEPEKPAETPADTKKSDDTPADASQSDLLAEVKKLAEAIQAMQPVTEPEKDTKKSEKDDVKPETPASDVAKSDKVSEALNAMQSVLEKIANQSMGRGSLDSATGDEVKKSDSKLGATAITKYFE